MQITELKEFAPLLAGAVAAGATILAVMVTSVFNLRVARLNIEAQSRQKAKELKLEKLEELYLLFDKWQLHLTSIYLHYLRCYRRQLEFNDVLDLVNKLTTLAPGEAQKYKMIMMVHFPSLTSVYEQVDAARGRLVPFLSDPLKNKLSAQDFESHQISFEQSCEIFKSNVSSLAHTTMKG